MKRTNADGNVANLFSDGDPGTGAPATIVDETWLNAVQEEIAKAIEGAGLTLDGLSTGVQLLQAIQIIAGAGGGIAAEKQVLANNQVAAANVTTLVFDKTVYYGARILYQVNRKTDTAASESVYSGVLYCQYSAQDDSWKIVDDARGEDADSSGTVFSITGAGQVQYVTDNMAGANYVGHIRFMDVKRFAI